MSEDDGSRFLDEMAAQIARTNNKVDVIRVPGAIILSKKKSTDEGAVQAEAPPAPETHFLPQFVQGTIPPPNMMQQMFAMFCQQMMMQMFGGHAPIAPIPPVQVPIAQSPIPPVQSQVNPQVQQFIQKVVQTQEVTRIEQPSPAREYVAAAEPRRRGKRGGVKHRKHVPDVAAVKNVDTSSVWTVTCTELQEKFGSGHGVPVCCTQHRADEFTGAAKKQTCCDSDGNEIAGTTGDDAFAKNNVAHRNLACELPQGVAPDTARFCFAIIDGKKVVRDVSTCKDTACTYNHVQRYFTKDELREKKAPMRAKSPQSEPKYRKARPENEFGEAPREIILADHDIRVQPGSKFREAAEDDPELHIDPECSLNMSTGTASNVVVTGILKRPTPELN